MGYSTNTMSKKSAHLILLVVDLAALFACYYVFNVYSDIISQINNQVEIIDVQKPLGMYALLIVVPVIHALGFVKIPENRLKLANISMVVFFIVLTVFSWIFDVKLEDKIEDAGYYYCSTLSESMTVSEFRTYLKDEDTCQ